MERLKAIEIDTPRGMARVELHEAPRPRGALVLGHGAGGGIGAKDLRAVTAAAVETGWTVALVEQPYRVAGRRSPPPAPHLDVAWEAVVRTLGEGAVTGLPLVTGGRSSGARVACRTAETLGVAGVLCLAFPLQPPARRSGTTPPSRLPELKALRVPVLVVQGRDDPFGMPRSSGNRKVVRVPGNHSLSTHLGEVTAAVREWLDAHVPFPGH